MTYEVAIAFDGNTWWADVESVHAHTWADTLEELDRSVREAIACAEGLSASFDEATLNIAYREMFV